MEKFPEKPFLRAPLDPNDAEKRAVLIQRASAARADVLQYFADIASWNENARKPHEAPIDPDPDGQMAELLRYLDTLLAQATY